MMTAKVQSAGKRTYYFRSHVLGLRLRKVAHITGLLTAWHPAGAKEINVLGLRLRKVNSCNRLVPLFGTLRVLIKGRVIFVERPYAGR